MPEPSFRTPIGNRVGDVVLMLVVGALFVGLAALLHPAFGLVVLLALIALFRIMPFSWVLVLEAEHAWVGFWGLGRRVPYGSVRSLRAGTLSDLAGTKQVDDGVPLVIEGTGGKVEIRLRRADAQAAVTELHARCPHASGIDLQGNDLLPSDPREAALARPRLARSWTAQAVAALGLSAVIVVAVAIITLAPEPRATSDLQALSTRIQHRRAVAGCLVILPATLGYGIMALRRARRLRSDPLR